MSLPLDAGALARQIELVKELGWRLSESDRSLMWIDVAPDDLSLFGEDDLRQPPNAFHADWEAAMSSFPADLGVQRGSPGLLWHLLCTARARRKLVPMLQPLPQKVFRGSKEVRLAIDAFLFSETLAAVPEATFVLVVAYCLSTRLVDDLAAVTGAANPERGSVSVRANVVGRALAKKGALSLHGLRDMIAGLDR